MRHHAILRLAACVLALSCVGHAPGHAAADPLPLPPDMPRIADGPDYDRCLDLAREDPEEARSFADAWAARGGGDGALHCAAMALFGLGEPARAGEWLEALASRSGAGDTDRAGIYAQAVQAWVASGQPNRAYAAATMGLTLAPEEADLMLDRAQALGALGRYAEAIGDLDQALAREPLRVEALVLRAAAHRHLNRLDAAVRDVGVALALAPDSPEGLLERGIIRQWRGDTHGARSDWEQAIRVAPESAAAELAEQNLSLDEAGPQRR